MGNNYFAFTTEFLKNGKRDNVMEGMDQVVRKIVWRIGVSIPLPTACEAVALPFELIPHIFLNLPRTRKATKLMKTHPASTIAAAAHKDGDANDHPAHAAEGPTYEHVNSFEDDGSDCELETERDAGELTADAPISTNTDAADVDSARVADSTGSGATAPPAPAPPTASPPASSCRSGPAPRRTPGAGPTPVDNVPGPEGAWNNRPGTNSPRTGTGQSAMVAPRSGANVRFVAPSSEQLALLVRNRDQGIVTPVAEMDAMVNVVRAPIQSWLYTYTDDATRFISEEKAVAAAMTTRLPTMVHQEAMATLVCCRRDVPSGCFAWGFHSSSAGTTLASVGLSLPVRTANGKLQPTTFYFEPERASSGFWVDIPEFPFTSEAARTDFHQTIAAVAPSWVFGGFHQYKPTATSAGAVTSRYRLLFLGSEVPTGLLTPSGRHVDGFKYQGRAMRCYAKTSAPHYQRLEWLDLDVVAATIASEHGFRASKKQRPNPEPANPTTPLPWTTITTKRTLDNDRPPRPFASATMYSVLQERVQITFTPHQVWKDQRPVAYNDMTIKLQSPANEAPPSATSGYIDRVVIHDGRSKRVAQSLDQLLAEFAELDAKHTEMATTQAASAHRVATDEPSFDLAALVRSADVDGVNAALAANPIDFGYQLHLIAEDESSTVLEDLVRQRVLHRALRARFGGRLAFHRLFESVYGVAPTLEMLHCTFESIDPERELTYTTADPGATKTKALWARQHESAVALAELLLAAFFPSLYASDVAMGLVSGAPIVHIPTFNGSPCLASSSIAAVFSKMAGPAGQFLDDNFADITAARPLASISNQAYSAWLSWSDNVDTLADPTTGLQLMAGDRPDTWLLRVLDGSPVSAPRG